jgi:tetratricopeptide (TPR) repeat protein
MTNRIATGLVLLAVIGGLAACASAPLKKGPDPALARADILVSEGCYDCLIEARDIYATAAVGAARASVLPRLFETTVLLGLREKELALDPAARFADAKALVPQLPPTYSAAAYLEMAEAVLPDQGGTARRHLAQIRRPNPTQYNAWQASLQAGQDSLLFRRYLAVSLDCSFGISLGTRPAAPATRTPPPGATAATPPPGATAAAPSAVSATTPLASTWAGLPDASTDPSGNLLTYRRANCLRSDRVVLGGLAEGDERFLEAGVLAGRMRPQAPTRKDMADARKWLTAASAKWPDSPAVSMALGSLNQQAGDCRAALTHYDRTLALEPLHEPAHLGRLVCLSYLQQHVAAIDQASDMIKNGVEEGESRYWRAWNERETGKLPEARADTDRMKQILFNDRALTLAGQIEHDQDDLDVAEKDLKEAKRLNDLNCIAAWYFALVQMKRQAWTPTAEGFVGAMTCYESAVAYDKAKLEEMKQADVDEDFRAVQIAGFEAAIKDDTSQVSASAFNAAVNYAKANNREKALEYCDAAARDPGRAKQAADLRALIVK